MTYDLKKLRETADRIGDEMFNERQTVRGSINWGDFCCVSAEHYVTEEGDEGYRVYFEEADPNNPDAENFIRTRLIEEGFHDIEVNFEW